ncbi:MAG: P-II family nitrogen regulator [Clostridiales Family XIII bacterium]|jgi:nitrogen regulatory protein PII|nr:P-II family nitrogen regulator [Clostridiales Family XIII bacterium]
MRLEDYKNADYSLIMTIVNRGYADQVVDASREAGARGGTILYARGTGIHETEKFMDIDIQPEKEIVLTLVRRESLRPIIHSILEAAGLRTKGRGISITLPVTDVVGITDEEITEYIDANKIDTE